MHCYTLFFSVLTVFLTNALVINRQCAEITMHCFILKEKAAKRGSSFPLLLKVGLSVKIIVFPPFLLGDRLSVKCTSICVGK